METLLTIYASAYGLFAILLAFFISMDIWRGGTIGSKILGGSTFILSLLILAMVVILCLK